MRLLISVAALLLAAALPAVQAQSNSTSPLAVLPECARLCLGEALIQSSCALTDKACICSDNKLQDTTARCVERACTIKESLFTLNTTKTACGAPVRDQREPLRVITITLGTLSGVFVAMRVLARLLIIGGPLGADDWFIVTTLLTGIPDTVMIVHGAIANGLGLDVWTLPSETITEFGRWFFIMEIVYFALISMTKMSLLFFYLRIFPTKGIRRLIWATVAFNTVYGLVFVLVGVFQCQPVEFFWERWDAEHKGRCLDINAIPWANGAISIALDLWMLALPLSQLRSLKLHWKKKVGVGMMFGVGTFVTVVSILRLQSFLEFASSNNPTWDHWDLTNWSTIEINVGIMCACLPSLRLLLVRAFPLLGGSSGGYGSRAARYYDAAPSKGFSRPVTAGDVGEGVELGESPSTRRQHKQQGSREFGVNSTVERGSLEDVDAAAAKGGITYSRSYQVSYGEQDEKSLVGSPTSDGARSEAGGKRGGEETRTARRGSGGDGGRDGGSGARGGHGYHRRFHAGSSKASTIGSASIEKIPEHV